jgi:hypothetical protein
VILIFDPHRSEVSKITDRLGDPGRVADRHLQPRLTVLLTPQLAAADRVDAAHPLAVLEVADRDPRRLGDRLGKRLRRGLHPRLRSGLRDRLWRGFHVRLRLDRGEGGLARHQALHLRLFAHLQTQGREGAGRIL